ncbi:putative PKHD-type hydroxylase [Trifolium pratense]|uniref:Putative PKHD-type hydroxylase n=1 Tax=Trifolium pratense TaxID=57577 RepID=A0A2K3NA73_TRIPR|nr:putative PKHD-type hydroxylase [Trifolium pratense]
MDSEMSHQDGNYNESPAKSEVIGNGTVTTMANSRLKLRVHPNKDHKPEGYDDLDLDFNPSIFSSLERYLPSNMLGIPRDDKAKFMREILLKYLPSGERHRVWFQFSISLFAKF